MIRKGSLSNQDVGLSLKALDHVLRRTIQAHSSDSDLKRLASSEFTEAAELFDTKHSLQQHFQNILEILRSFISTPKQLPCDVVYEVHTVMGLLFQRMKHHCEACTAFLRALWVVNTSNFPREELTYTLHRMSISKVELKEYKEASHMLQRTIGLYESWVRKDDSRLKDAIRLKAIADEGAIDGERFLSERGLKRLSFIAESPEDCLDLRHSHH